MKLIVRALFALWKIQAYGDTWDQAEGKMLEKPNDMR